MNVFLPCFTHSEIRFAPTARPELLRCGGTGAVCRVGGRRFGFNGECTGREGHSSAAGVPSHAAHPVFQTFVEGPAVPLTRLTTLTSRCCPTKLSCLPPFSICMEVSSNQPLRHLFCGRSLDPCFLLDSACSPLDAPHSLRPSLLSSRMACITSTEDMGWFKCCSLTFCT